MEFFDFLFEHGEFEPAVAELGEEHRKEVESRLMLMRQHKIDFSLDDFDAIADGTFDTRPSVPPETNRTAPRPVQDFNLTDLGNAERLVDRYGSKIRFCKELGQWLVWDEKRWLIDETFVMERMATQVVRSINKEAQTLKDDRVRHELIMHSVKSENPTRINAMLRLAKSQKGIQVSVDDLDNSPWFLNCQNGTLDLRTGCLLPHRREDMITRILPVEYDPSLRPDEWITFLETIFEENEKLMGYIQRVVGYCITGNNREQCMWVFHGTGANGKSTLLETLRNLMQDYARQADFSTLKKKRVDTGIRNDIARINGARLLTAVETEKGDYLDEVLIKRLTGGDTITARQLYKESFEFRNTAKVILAANDIPKIRGKDHGIWRRVKIVPFNVRIPENQQDKHLQEKLLTELPGILSWAVQGCINWQLGGLEPPGEVTDATDVFKREMDSVATFIGARCRTDYNLRVKKSELFDAYQKWCFEKRLSPAGRKTFGSEVLGLGYGTASSNGSYFTGLNLIPDAGDGDDDIPF